MLYCEKCRVRVTGQPECCPLCQGPLVGRGNPEEEVFPTLAGSNPAYQLLIRGIIFLSIATVVICGAINLMLGGKRWSLFVAAGIACMWLCLWVVIRRRNNIPKSIIWMVFLLSLLAVAWDIFTGWRRWSVEYVIPSLCLFAMGSMAVIARVLHLQIADYLIYVIIDGLFGIVPALFMLFGWVHMAYPSIICVAGSLISLAALFSFEGESLKAEFRKRLHL